MAFLPSTLAIFILTILLPKVCPLNRVVLIMKYNKKRNGMIFISSLILKSGVIIPKVKVNKK